FFYLPFARWQDLSTMTRGGKASSLVRQGGGAKVPSPETRARQRLSFYLLLLRFLRMGRRTGGSCASAACRRCRSNRGRHLKEVYLSSGRRYAVSGIPFSKLSCIASPVRHVAVSCARRLLSRGGSLRWPVLDLVLQISQTVRHDGVCGMH